MGHKIVETDDPVEGLSIALDGEFTAVLVNLSVLKERKYEFLRAERWGGGRSLQVMAYRGWLAENAERQLRYLKIEQVRFDPGSLAEIVQVLEESPHTDWLAPREAFKARLPSTRSA
jgi:hypothetical protein